MIALRVATTPDDLVAWARVKSQVVPNEPVTAEQLAASQRQVFNTRSVVEFGHGGY